MGLSELLMEAIKQGASDLHVTVGVPPMIRKGGVVVPIGKEVLLPENTEAFAKEILNEEQYKAFINLGELDISFSLRGLGRFRVNVYRQRGTCCIAVRIINSQIPSLHELGLPGVVSELARKTKGLLLVTGPTGSGKSTTLAAMIDQMNTERQGHILTLEDPIEYLHKHRNCMVNQREVGTDTFSYANALKAALREDPDVILVGEMRDLETIGIAVTAAETGHFVLSTLHTIGAANTIDRIIDVFPPHQQQQIRVQISAILQGVVSQQLLPRRDKPGRIAAIEVMVTTTAIKNLIREGKTHQINTIIQTGGKFGMETMEKSLIDLYKRGIISYDDAITHASDPDNITRYIGSNV